MAEGLSMAARREITKKFAREYAKVGKAEKSRLLDSLVETTGWTRDHARRAIRHASARVGAARDHERVVRVLARPGLALLVTGCTDTRRRVTDRAARVVPRPASGLDQRVQQPALLSLAHLRVLAGELLRDLTARSHRQPLSHPARPPATRTFLREARADAPGPFG